MSFNMKGILPQSISRAYLIMKSRPSHGVLLQRASAQHSIAARMSFNTPTSKSINSRQVHSRGYCSPSFIAPKPKGTSKSGNPSTDKDNSNITTRNHAYYKRYSISGFYPVECTSQPLPKEQSKEDEKVKKTNPKQTKVQAKKTGHEHTRPVHSYSHTYYKQFSINGFYRINESPAGSIPCKKPSTVEPKDEHKDEPKNEHVCSIKTCNHDYYRVFSISGFYPPPNSTPSNPESNKPACISREMSMAEALALAAAYVPSPSSHQKTNENIEHLNLEYDIDTSAQTIEELGFEALGITGFQGARDDMEGGQCMIEDDGNDEGAFKTKEGGPSPVRAGLSAIWLLLRPI
ncbi:hypothetical protein EAE96_001131 [Botrytis aclada]|nr:hypothetical protein EAE96_001131 [Botrytis aclada]